MRAFTSTEIDEFRSEYPNVTASSLPPWGGVMEYNGLRVLVFFTYTGALHITDITDQPQLLSNISKEWNPNTLSWWYHIPSEFAGRVAELYTQLANVAGNIGGSLEDTITGIPDVLSLATPAGMIAIIGVGVVILLIMNKAK
jgi:hypothetical protein